MASGIGSIIEAVDYNSIRSKIINVMGAGSGQTGYGQTTLSTTVAAGNIVTKEQWDALRYDLLNARIHQDGLVPLIVLPETGQPIRFGSGHPNSQYNTQAELAITNKWNLGSGQFVIDAGTITDRSTPWISEVTTTCTVTFNTVDQARWFFNSGGKIRVTSSRTGGTGSPQNSTWSSLLATAGTQALGGNNAGVNFYNLTNSYQLFYQSSASSPYGGNQYRIDVLSNVTDNSVGGATILTFRIRFTDNYTYGGTGGPSFPDTVDGTLSVIIDEIRASGTLQPLGTGPFVLTRPVYSITSLSGS
jgi:hypothetical protein